MRCPRDSTELTVAVKEGFTAYACETCGGLWIPHRSLEATRHERPRFSWEEMRRELERTAKPSQLRCVSGCGTLSASVIEAVEVDWCTACQGIWFDPGEARRVLAQRQNQLSNHRHSLAQVPAGPHQFAAADLKGGIDVGRGLLRYANMQT